MIIQMKPARVERAGRDVQAQWLQCERHLDSGLDEVQPEGQGFPHEDVRVVGGLERLLQLLQLPAAVVGPCPPLLYWPLLIWKAKRTRQLHSRHRVTRS